MKFYISATIDNRNEARKIMSYIVNHGQTLSLDWTNDSILNKPYIDIINQAQCRSDRDIEAIRNSDVFVLLSSNNSIHKGSYVELGAAIATNIVKNKPKIFIIGKFKDDNIFNFHSKVQRIKSIADVFTNLNL